MTIDQDIEELLRQDEALLKAKRRRLKAFGGAIDELRQSTSTAAQLAAEMVAAGDLSRVDLGRVFKLTRAEKSALLGGRNESAAPTQEDGSDDQSDPLD
ncbi:hypothetical protein NS220_14245 [Microbacterium testaceum]|uniref:Uncharacterized protein n=1 Tax=Microbacterium testaceum TaxID=2033 RepID=A0A147EUJ2_MICTE|nr:hypothetical protein [Microbacterium testaceum]KTR92597.1 hypothetical protein NS220_14245 [Microbacterium testaceum]